MLRLILLAAIVYVLFHWLRRGTPASRKPRAFDPPSHGVEEMVQDPACGTWIPVSQAISVQREKEVLYFCSVECRDKFLVKRTNG